MVICFKKIKIGIFLGLALLLVMPVFSYADNKIGISVDKTIFNLATDAGTTNTTIKFNIQNNTDKSNKISISAFDYVLGDENEIRPTEDANKINGLRDWLSADASDFSLSAGEKKEVSILAKVPVDAVVGSHWGGIAIDFMPEDNREVDASSLLVNGQIGVHVLLNVNGETNGAGRLNTFKAPLFIFDRVAFSSEYEDIGNIHYIPHGEITIKNVLSGSKSKIVLGKHFAFPGRKFTYTADWNNSMSWASAYSAQNIFVDGSGNVHTQTRYMFGVLFFPLLLLICVILVFFWKFIRKRR